MRPDGGGAEVMTGMAPAATTVIVTICVTLGIVPLAAWTVKLVTPAAIGVPLNTPVTLFKIRPAGGAPVVTLQVLAGLPEAANVVLYGLPTVPAG